MNKKIWFVTYKKPCDGENDGGEVPVECDSFDNACDEFKRLKDDGFASVVIVPPKFYIDYLDSTNNFRETRQWFTSDEQAWDWAKNNLSNPVFDQVKSYDSDACIDGW